MNWEIGIDIHTLICITQITNKNLLYKKINFKNSKKEKQISYINAYMWNLEKWYRRTGLQGRNRDIDVDNKRMDTKGGT